MSVMECSVSEWYPRAFCEVSEGCLRGFSARNCVSGMWGFREVSERFQRVFLRGFRARNYVNGMWDFMNMWSQPRRRISLESVTSTSQQSSHFDSSYKVSVIHVYVLERLLYV